MICNDAAGCMVAGMHAAAADVVCQPAVKRTEISIHNQ